MNKFKKKMGKKGHISIIVTALTLIALIAGYLILRFVFNYVINIVFIVGIVLLLIISTYVFFHLGKHIHTSVKINKCIKTGKCEVKK